MPNATNERLHQILSAQTNVVDLFIIRALERILFELDPNAEDEILDDMLPDAPNTQAVMFGRQLGVYSGMSRTTLKAKFTKPDGSALTDADVDAIFAALGVTSGTSLAGPGGGEPMGATAEGAPLIERKSAMQDAKEQADSKAESAKAEASKEDGTQPKGAAKKDADKKDK